MFNFTDMSITDLKKRKKKLYNNMLQWTIQDVDKIHEEIDAIESELAQREQSV